MLGITIDQIAFGVKGFMLACHVDPDHWVEVAKKGRFVQEVVDVLTNVKL